MAIRKQEAAFMVMILAYTIVGFIFLLIIIGFVIGIRNNWHLSGEAWRNEVKRNWARCGPRLRWTTTPSGGDGIIPGLILLLSRICFEKFNERRKADRMEEQRTRESEPYVKRPEIIHFFSPPEESESLNNKAKNG